MSRPLPQYASALYRTESRTGVPTPPTESPVCDLSRTWQRTEPGREISSCRFRRRLDTSVSPSLSVAAGTAFYILGRNAIGESEEMGHGDTCLGYFRRDPCSPGEDQSEQHRESAEGAIPRHGIRLH